MCLYGLYGGFSCVLWRSVHQSPVLPIYFPIAAIAPTLAFRLDLSAAYSARLLTAAVLYMPLISDLSKRIAQSLLIGLSTLTRVNSVCRC